MSDDDDKNYGYGYGVCTNCNYGDYSHSSLCAYGVERDLTNAEFLIDDIKALCLQTESFFK
jgi:hypothetical protein